MTDPGPEDDSVLPREIYDGFAATYLSPWGSGGAREWLDECAREHGFHYEDEVKLDFKHHLNAVSRISRMGEDDFIIQFEGVKPGDNSDCLGAVEDYLRVFACERGCFDTYENSINLFGECDTRFPGLALEQEPPPRNDEELPVMGGMYRVQAFDYNIITIHVPGHGREVNEALRALLRKVRLAKGLPEEEVYVPPPPSRNGHVSTHDVLAPDITPNVAAKETELT